MYENPATPDAAIQYLKELRAAARLMHEKRMAEWKHFGTHEYRQEVTEELLRSTHEDMEPPWLRDPAREERDVGCIHYT